MFIQKALSSRHLLPSLFFFSGFSALIYQISWQRVLLDIYGSNIESASLIISIFMMGLAIGSLAGGQISKRSTQSLPLIFMLVEISIAVFGLFSIGIIKTTGAFVMASPLVLKIIVIFFILIVPTALMGMTLPILVQHMRTHSQTSLEIISNLYYLNTLGAACAAFFTILLTFMLLGLSGSVALAALSNLFVGVATYASIKNKQ